MQTSLSLAVCDPIPALDASRLPQCTLAKDTVKIGMRVEGNAGGAPLGMAIVFVRVVIVGPSIDGDNGMLIIYDAEEYPGVSSIIN